MGPRICFVVGARPNFMKAAPVVAALADRGATVRLVHTGQHYDADMSDIFLTQLGLPRPDAFLGVGSGSHAEQTARALVGVEAELREHSADFVIVPGDVNSTLAGALAAVKLGVPVGHLEAGLRSFDNAMPEEHNRRLTDHLSTLLLVHSESAIENLRGEGIDAGVAFVGNTMIDSMLSNLASAEASAPLTELDIEARGYGLVTLHRPALVDEPSLLRGVASGLVELAQDRPIVFPVHPRTKKHLDRLGLDAPLQSAGVRLTPPLSYLAFLGLEQAAAFVLTDSGGVQEETSALGVRCFTLRDTTERPVTVELGTNAILGARPERIAEIPALLETAMRGMPIPLWDGRAGERAADAVLKALA